MPWRGNGFLGSPSRGRRRNRPRVHDSARDRSQRNPSRGSSARGRGRLAAFSPAINADRGWPALAVSHFDPPDKGNVITTTVAWREIGQLTNRRRGEGRDGAREARIAKRDWRKNKGRKKKTSADQDATMQDGDSQGRRGQKWRSYVYSRTGRTTHQLLEIKLGIIGFLLLSLLLNDRLELILILLSS